MGVARAKTILIVAGAIIATIVVESFLGSTRYQLNGVAYFVPHRYESMRNFSVFWLMGVQGLDEEPVESVWLLFPSSDLVRGVHGYARTSRGYSSQVPTDIVVNVLGGKEASEFPADRRNDLIQVAAESARGVLREADRTTGWIRVYWWAGEDSAEAGSPWFYLIPSEGLEHLPIGWRVPHCLRSQDVDQQETYKCRFEIFREGLTYAFSLDEENLATADYIPIYVHSRLRGWIR